MPIILFQDKLDWTVDLFKPGGWGTRPSPIIRHRQGPLYSLNQFKILSFFFVGNYISKV